MAGFKVDRASQDIKRELTDIMRSLKDPRVQGFLTIVKVELSNDFSYCKIFVSSMDGMEDAKNAVKGLESASGFIKRELGLRLKMRKIPSLKFIPDDSASYGMTISKMLKDIEEKEQAIEAQAGEEDGE